MPTIQRGQRTGMGEGKDTRFWHIILNINTALYSYGWSKFFDMFSN